jgi:Co/Zn/Cd efflux system component
VLLKCVISTAHGVNRLPLKNFCASRVCSAREDWFSTCGAVLNGLAALAVNLFCAILLSAYRSHSGSLTRAAFLSARNDAIANMATIAAGFVTAHLWNSAWPDLIVGAGIAFVNADAARAVLTAAREEHRASHA